MSIPNAFSCRSSRVETNENDPDGLSTYNPYMIPRTMEPPKTLPSFALPSFERTPVPAAYRSRIAHGLFSSSCSRRSSRSRLACRPQYACTQNTPHRHAIKTTRKHPKKNKDASLDPARETAPPDASFRPILGSKGVRFRDGPWRARSRDRRGALSLPGHAPTRSKVRIDVSNITAFNCL